VRGRDNVFELSVGLLDYFYMPTANNIIDSVMLSEAGLSIVSRPSTLSRAVAVGLAVRRISQLATQPLEILVPLHITAH